MNKATCNINEQSIILEGGLVIKWDEIEIIGKLNKFSVEITGIGNYGDKWIEYYVKRFNETKKHILLSTRTEGVFVPLEIFGMMEKLIEYGLKHPHIKFEERGFLNHVKSLDIEAECKMLTFAQSPEAKAIRNDFTRQIPL